MAIKIDHPERAKGLNRLLYKCPRCGTEGKMEARGVTLSCSTCGKSWYLNEQSHLEGIDDRTEFSEISEWLRWERDIVRERIRNGTYYFEDTVRIETLNNSQEIYKQSEGKLVQTPDGTTLTCYSQPMTVEKPALSLESMHVEYDYLGQGDCVEISGPNENLLCYLTKKDVLTQLSIATEEIYIYANEKREQEMLAILNNNKENENGDNKG
ncbi:MAG: hypothetical protein IJ404_04650 [Clostridia bacterium]|nr:hypothetical protein [Clostridia bacterium]